MIKTPFALLVVALSFSACGSLKTEKKAFDQNRWALTTSGQALSPEAFASACQAKPGMMLANNTICRFEAYRNVLSEGSGTINESADYPLTDIPSGSAVEASGSVTSNAAEVILNGTRLTSIPTTSAIITNGGTLGFRVRPGSLYGVKVFVYSCTNQSQQAVRCPQ